jgi:pimeloyl-ACP methyl ester carboxylesterase
MHGAHERPTYDRVARMSERGVVRLRDGGKLSFETLGRPNGAPPLLLLRPLGGSMALWGELAERLAHARQVIAFDPRGVGQSSDPPWTYTTQAMARDAVELLDAQKVPRAHVFGLSLGGMVASWLAIAAPERVARLILASTLPRPERISHRIVNKAPRLLRALMRHGVEAEVGLVQQILSSRFVAEHPDRVRAIGEAVRRHPTRGRNLAKLALAAARHDAEPWLRNITAPSLILVGDRDPIAGARSQAELLHDIPNARLIIIADSGHDLSLEQPAATAAAVHSFLAEASWSAAT